jgi:hypothetical protein
MHTMDLAPHLVRVTVTRVLTGFENLVLPELLEEADEPMKLGE